MTTHPEDVLPQLPEYEEALDPIDDLRSTSKALMGSGIEHEIPALQEFKATLETRTVDADLSPKYWTQQIHGPIRPVLGLWPDSLYVPQDSTYRHYGILSAPASHQYRTAWESGPFTDASYARVSDGKLFSYAFLNQKNPVATSVRTETGLGIQYSPSFEYGTVKFAPRIQFGGTLASIWEFDTRLQGEVTVTADLILASWQVIPNGYDFLASKAFRVHGIVGNMNNPAYRWDVPAQPDRSATFVVQKGRTYLFGAVLRVQIDSGVVDNQGRVPHLEGNGTYSYASVTALIPQMRLTTEHIFLP